MAAALEASATALLQHRADQASRYAQMSASAAAARRETQVLALQCRNLQQDVAALRQRYADAAAHRAHLAEKSANQSLRLESLVALSGEQCAAAASACAAVEGCDALASGTDASGRGAILEALAALRVREAADACCSAAATNETAGLLVGILGRAARVAAAQQARAALVALVGAECRAELAAAANAARDGRNSLSAAVGEARRCVDARRVSLENAERECAAARQAQCDAASVACQLRATDGTRLAADEAASRARCSEAARDVSVASEATAAAATRRDAAAEALTAARSEIARCRAAVAKAADGAAAVREARLAAERVCEAAAAALVSRCEAAAQGTAAALAAAADGSHAACVLAEMPSAAARQVADADASARATDEAYAAAERRAVVRREEALRMHQQQQAEQLTRLGEAECHCRAALLIREVTARAFAGDAAVTAESQIKERAAVLEAERVAWARIAGAARKSREGARRAAEQRRKKRQRDEEDTEEAEAERENHPSSGGAPAAPVPPVPAPAPAPTPTTAALHPALTTTIRGPPRAASTDSVWSIFGDAPRAAAGATGAPPPRPPPQQLHGARSDAAATPSTGRKTIPANRVLATTPTTVPRAMDAVPRSVTSFDPPALPLPEMPTPSPDPRPPAASLRRRLVLPPPQPVAAPLAAQLPHQSRANGGGLLRGFAGGRLDAGVHGGGARPPMLPPHLTPQKGTTARRGRQRKEATALEEDVEDLFAPF